MHTHVCVCVYLSQGYLPDSLLDFLLPHLLSLSLSLSFILMIARNNKKQAPGTGKMVQM